MRNTRYLRFAALGDSTACGIGDPVPAGWRGWARLLADALGTRYGMSYCNVAVSGATSSAVRELQLDAALSHRPDLASLIVGVNDSMRSTWDPVRLRADLMECADALHGQGELLLAEGLVFELPDLSASGGFEPSWRRDLAWMLAQGAPWFGRRARDLGPWAVRLALTEARRNRQPTPL